MRNNNNKIIFAGVAMVIIFIALIVIGICAKVTKHNIGGEDFVSKYSLEEMLQKIQVKEGTPVKGSVNLGQSSLYDELPEIDKYPLQVKGDADIVLEVFSSGEKAGSNYESWLIDVANSFNNNHFTTQNGKSVAISVRQMSSGMGADYIISNKYLPDLYTPSNELFGKYVETNGGDLELVSPRLVGNTAGVLVDKNKGYKSIKEVADAVSNNQINLGYTNPQSSASGLNFLISLLKNYDSANMLSDGAAKKFAEFQNNIPFVAYTTMQMRDSAKNGTLDGMIMEYQTYINEEDLNGKYDFIPYGIRHDNPLYGVGSKINASPDRKEAVQLFSDFCANDACQKMASKKGFNNNEDYKSEYEVTGADITQALDLYKKNKDSGKDIIAVFIADCSGSMDGEPLRQLKESLANGAQYINENNMVGLISYSDDVTVELPIAKFDLNQRAYFQGAIDNLQAWGGTASYDAVLVGVDMIKKAQEANPNAKVMLFLLSDGMANEGYMLDDIDGVLKNERVPVYTISYTEEADKEAMQALSNVNEAASINADSDDIIYKIKSLFNSQM
ncbi:MAG: VWA domain-containing protein [Eubacteriales bacterium]|nr:VWA domain-containing protein [Eubacteriales bacterium]